jgi:thiol-disulfide isomerase/thioredoxin
MKSALHVTVRALLAALALCASGVFGHAAEPAAAPVPAAAPAAASPAAMDLQALIDRIQAKLKAGQRSAAALADELQEFDALSAKYRDPQSEDAARIPMLQSMLYVQVLDQTDKAVAILGQVKRDFPNTEAAKAVDQILQEIEQRAAAEKAKLSVLGKPAPALNFIWSSNAALKSLADLKGKVVVLDFWATWCGPCVASFPEIRELAAHYKDAEVVVVGVTSLQGSILGLPGGPIDCRDNPEKEKSSLAEFAKAKDMTWTVAISAEEVFNPAYGVTGIPHMAIVAPDGTVRHNGLHPSSPLAEKTALIDALLKEAGKKVP